jgi:glycerol-3-phosphate O-acyltransferase
VPVYIGDEKLMEGSTSVAELGGKPKKKESLLGILLTARRLRREFGRVRVNFGHPLALAGLLDAQHPDWPTENADPKAPWLRSAVLATANELSLRINDAATINPINLVALALLATPRHVADRQLLQRQIEHLQALLEAAPYGDTLIPCRSSPAEIVDHALHIDAVEQVPHALGDLIRAEPRQAALLAYFRNNVLHVFLLPSLLACLVSQNPLLSQARAREAIPGLYGLLRTELFLHWPPEQLDTALDAVETALIGRGMISRDPQLALWRAPEPNSDAYADLRQLGEIVRPTLDRLFLALTLLQHHGSGTLTRTTFTEAGQLLAERLSLLYAFGGSELADKSVFAQTLVDLTDAEFVTVSDDGRLCFDERILRPASYAELLLPAEVRHTIERMTRNGGSAAPAPLTHPASR